MISVVASLCCTAAAAPSCTQQPFCGHPTPESALWQAALHCAASVGNAWRPPLVQQAITPDTFGRLPLHYSAARGDLVGIRSSFNGDMKETSVTHEDIWGWTPLHFAAFFGHFECTKLLIELGGSVTARCRLGRTPLHLAAIGGSSRIYRFLVDSGGDASATDVFSNVASAYLTCQEESLQAKDVRRWASAESQALVVIRRYSDTLAPHVFFALWQDGVVVFVAHDYRERAKQLLAGLDIHEKVKALQQRSHLRAQLRVGHVPNEKALMIGREAADIVSKMHPVGRPFDVAHVRIDCAGTSIEVEDRFFGASGASPESMEKPIQVDCERIIAFLEMRLPLNWLPAVDFLDCPRFDGLL